MAAKLIVLSILIMALALGLLRLRVERVQLARDLARCDQQARAVRVDLWQAQDQVAAITTPDALAERLGAAQLALEPVAPPMPAAESAQLARAAADTERTASP